MVRAERGDPEKKFVVVRSVRKWSAVGEGEAGKLLCRVVRKEKRKTHSRGTGEGLQRPRARSRATGAHIPETCGTDLYKQKFERCLFSYWSHQSKHIK